MGSGVLSPQHEGKSLLPILSGHWSFRVCQTALYILEPVRLPQVLIVSENMLTSSVALPVHLIAFIFPPSGQRESATWTSSDRETVVFDP
jgi:hypothetical protein